MTLPYVLELIVAIPCSIESPRALRRQLASHLGSGAVELTWREVECVDDGRSILAVCEAVGPDYATVKDAAVSAAAAAGRIAFAGSDAAVSVRGAGLVLSPRPAVLSDEDRWGWYAVTVEVCGAILEADPTVAEWIKAQLPKMQRFRASSVEWLRNSDRAKVSVLTLARSPNAAFGEANDAVENLLWGAAKDPGDYTVEPDNVEWVGPETRKAL
jgi:hypothetical protein